MERVATGWLALETGGGPLSVGVVLAARTVPSLLFGLAAGAVADRVDRRRVLLIVAISAALLALGLGRLVGTGSIALWQVATIAFFNGCVQVADPPSRQALVFDTVGRRTAPNAIALNAVASRLMGAVGAFAGGIVIPTFGVANCYLLVAVGYLLGGLLAVTLRVDDSGTGAVARLSFGRLLAGAGRLVVERPIIRTLVVAAMTCEVFGFSYMTAVPGFARDVLQSGAAGLGTLTAASAIGATVAVLLLAGLPSRIRREPLLAVVYVAYGLAIVAFSLASSLVLATAFMMVIGGCSSAFDALEQMMIQLAVPEDQRGRAVGIWVFSIGTAPAGHLEVGALAATVGSPLALLVNGGFVVLGALVLALRSPLYRPWPARQSLKSA
jgi:predicted MFS family arabinose efflux permease